MSLPNPWFSLYRTPVTGPRPEPLKEPQELQSHPLPVLPHRE